MDPRPSEQQPTPVAAGRQSLHTITFGDDTLAELHALRAAAGMSRLSDASMLQVVLMAGVEAERASLRDLAEPAISDALGTVPASMRGPEWMQAREHLTDMQARGIL